MTNTTQPYAKIPKDKKMAGWRYEALKKKMEKVREEHPVRTPRRSGGRSGGRPRKISERIDEGGS